MDEESAWAPFLFRNKCTTCYRIFFFFPLFFSEREAFQTVKIDDAIHHAYNVFLPSKRLPRFFLFLLSCDSRRVLLINTAGSGREDVTWLYQLVGTGVWVVAWSRT